MFVRALDPHMQVLDCWDFNDVAFVTGVINVNVDPRLSVRSITVPVRIAVKDFWIETPNIWVIEQLPWLKTGNPDWHVSGNRLICFELHDRWAGHLIKLLDQGRPDVTGKAAQWIVRAAAHVLHVHYTCYRLGIDNWPEEFAPTWPHGAPGSELYQLEEQQQSNPNKHDRKVPRN